MRRATIVCALAALLVPGGGAAKERDGALRAEVEALKASVAIVRERVRAEEDFIAIVNLQNAYGYYGDKSMGDHVADLFSREATLEILGRGVFKGHERIREYFRMSPPLMRGGLFNHMPLQPAVHVAPDGVTAKARLRAFVQIAVPGRPPQWGEGTYENEYVREDGVWKISKLHFYQTYYIDFDKGWDKGGVALLGLFPQMPPDAPPSETYESYPGVYVPPFHYRNPVSGR